MKEAGYKMVRYADDFVILCKSQTEAEAALARVAELVRERGLTLHADKTSLVDTGQAGQCFDFLGYHFENNTCNLYMMKPL